MYLGEIGEFHRGGYATFDIKKKSKLRNPNEFFEMIAVGMLDMAYSFDMIAHICIIVKVFIFTHRYARTGMDIKRYINEVNTR